MTRQILVGDIGGTNTRFGIATVKDGQVQVGDFYKIPNDAHTDFDSALKSYLEQADQHPDQACFAIAGPVKHNSVKLTNRNWNISGEALQRAFGLTHVSLINDFAAMARAVPELSSDTFIELIPGLAEDNAPIIVAGPGTGFGVATLLQMPGAHWQVLQGEGGHMAYAPQNEVDFQISQILVRTYGYVSNELVASGSGLPAVHRAFCELYGIPYHDIPPGEMLELAANGDEMFTTLCTLRARTVLRAAGDLVLANGARGGVVLAGGVTERLLPYLQQDKVRKCFARRGPLSHYLSSCPVRIMTAPTAPLVGAGAAYYSNFTD
jgi:glucokinase